MGAGDFPTVEQYLGALKKRKITLNSSSTSKINIDTAKKQEEIKDLKKKIKTPCVTFTECFTLEQLQDHICSTKEHVKKIKDYEEEAPCSICGVVKLTFDPFKICFFCNIIIEKGHTYYTQEEQDQTIISHYFCKTCYTNRPSKHFVINNNRIIKKYLKELKNDECEDELRVECSKCGAWEHQVCCLFNPRKNENKALHKCLNCRMEEMKNEERVALPESYGLSAEKLPVCNLSRFLQTRLDNSLEKERKERADKLNKKENEVPTAENLTIRVVSSFDTNAIVSESIRLYREKLDESTYPSKFPYKSKGIALFQKIEGVDVLLFMMYVDEHGAQCPPPNRGHVNLAYIDSVKYFYPNIKTISDQPLRQFVYYEILVGYLAYIKAKGFTTFYIWASPPRKGESYIIHRHPDEQKNPKIENLIKWYHEMLRKAEEEGVVKEITYLYDQYFSIDHDKRKARISSSKLPYYDGEYLACLLEEEIKHIGQKYPHKAEQFRHQKSMIQRALKKYQVYDIESSSEFTYNHYLDILLMEKVGEVVKKPKDNRIIVHLQPRCKFCSEYIVPGNMYWDCSCDSNCRACSSCHTKLTKIDLNLSPSKNVHDFSEVVIDDISANPMYKDEDNEQHTIFDCRQTYLHFCRSKNYQFDTLRRAKHSTMMSLYEIFYPERTDL